MGSKWEISKEFSFCYGHRVWSQKLNSTYCASNDDQCKCRHLHGHEGKVHVYLSGNKLTNGMVTDFKHLGWLKDFLDDTLDHKFIIDSHDPMYSVLVDGVYCYPAGIFKYAAPLVPVIVPDTDLVAGKVVDLQRGATPDETTDVLAGMFIVDFVPTSENLAKWLHQLVSIKMQPLGVKCSRIDWWETPKSCATYFK